MAPSPGSGQKVTNLVFLIRRNMKEQNRAGLVGRVLVVAVNVVEHR